MKLQDQPDKFGDGKGKFRDVPNKFDDRPDKFGDGERKFHGFP